MNRLLLLVLLSTGPVFAQAVTPNFTNGSMTSTTTMTQTIDETITTTKYGGAVNTWSGTNVQSCTDSACGTLSNVNDSSAEFYVHTAGDDWTVDIQTRAASAVVEEIEVERTIETDSTTTSLSVFSQ